MPRYEYHCTRCEVAFDLVMTVDQMRRYESRLPRKCRVCGARAVRRLFGVPAIHGDELRCHGTLLDQCGGDEREAQRIVNAASRHGYRPGYNDFYDPSLATSPGDPAAFFKHQDGQSAKRRRLHDLQNRPLPKRTPLAEDLIQEHARRIIAQDPKKARKPRELREEIIDKYAYKRRDRERPDLNRLLPT